MDPNARYTAPVDRTRDTHLLEVSKDEVFMLRSRPKEGARNEETRGGPAGDSAPMLEDNVGEELALVLTVTAYRGAD